MRGATRRATVPLTPVPTGGSQAFVVDLARGLASRGHEVALYCAAPSDVPGVATVQIPVEAGLERALVAMKGRTRVLPGMGRAYAACYAELRSRGADAVSQHGFDAEAIELADRLPILHTLHLPPIVPGVVTAALKSKAAFGVPSAAARRDWLTAGLEGVRIVPNGVPDWDPGSLEPGGVALVVGRISPEKGVHEALLAADRAELGRLVIGPIYDSRYFKQQVRPLLRPGELLPAMPRERVWRVMARAVVLLAPIDWEEPYGLAAAEAQMVGCPVAGYRRGALPEIVEEGVSGYLAEAGDFEGLVAATRQASRLDRAAVRESARRRLSIERSIDAYETALSSIAA